MKQLLLLLSFFALSSACCAQTIFIVNSFQVAPAGPQVPDPDAQNAVTAIFGAGVPLDQTQADAINAWVAKGKTHGWWEGSRALYMPVWANQAANIINLKNPGTNNLEIFGTPFYEAGGTWWGTNGGYGYGLTGIRANDLEQNNLSLSVYQVTPGFAAYKFDMGAYRYFGGDNFAALSTWYTESAFLGLRDAGGEYGVEGQINGMHTVSRLASNDLKYFINGSQVWSVNWVSTNGVPNTTPIAVGGLNEGGGVSEMTDRKGAYYRIGAGLTAEQEAYHTNDTEELLDAFGYGVQ